VDTTASTASGPQRIGRTFAESTPRFAPRPKPAGAPNVLVVLLDDLGFAQLGAFGSDIDTPNIDRLASDGLRYNRFHVTALCSPSRASLLTGRNHHSVGMGFLCDMPTGFPGYSARMPESAAGLPRVLRDAGYTSRRAPTAPPRARSRPGHSASGSSATTDFFTATPIIGRPRSCRTITSSTRPGVPKTAIT
jgi:hypothetical protein